MFHFHFLYLALGSLCKNIKWHHSGIMQLVYCCNMAQLVWYHLVMTNSDLLLLVSHVCLQRGVRKGWETCLVDGTLSVHSLTAGI